MATQGNPATQYVQNEIQYLYCATCGRKDYNLDLVNQTASDNCKIGNYINGTWTAQTIYCNAYNSAPAAYPTLAAKSTPTQATYALIGTGYCQGTMTLTTQALATLNNELVRDERSSS